MSVRTTGVTCFSTDSEEADALFAPTWSFEAAGVAAVDSPELCEDAGRGKVAPPAEAEDGVASVLSGAVLAGTKSEGVCTGAAATDAWTEEQLWQLLSTHAVQSAPSVAALHGVVHLSNAQATCIARQEAHSSA
jgi:hypothetical protein